MTGPEHYREAERLAARADEIGADGVRLDPGDPLLLLAQVHATLALAAATAEPIANKWDGAECPGAMELAKAWTAAIS